MGSLGHYLALPGDARSVWSALPKLLELLLCAWVAALLGLLAARMFSGRIETRGILTGFDGRFSIARMQLLLVTIAFAAGYLGASLGRGAGQDLPEIPGPMLAALLGSHGVYLGGVWGALRRGGGKG